jgi:predicted nucleic acid-binding Zn ribbon protein
VSQDPTVKIAVLAQRLEGHEKVCAERYGEISKSFDRIHSRLDWIMRGVVGLLAAMLAWVVVNGVPWPIG